MAQIKHLINCLLVIYTQKFYIIVFILPIIICAKSEVPISNERALYVDKFDETIGDNKAEIELLEFVQRHKITSLLLYDLHKIDFTDASKNTLLALFISKAKSLYGIKKVAAVGENVSFFQSFSEKYNNSRTSSLEKVDIYNLEFEFWNVNERDTINEHCRDYLKPNKLRCTNEGAFEYFLKMLNEIKQIAATSKHKIEIETYIGQASIEQIQALSFVINNIRIHGYVNDYYKVVTYVEERVRYFLVQDREVNISIILSAEPEFMKNWFDINSLEKTETLLKNSFFQKNKLAIQDIGFTYFNYSELK